MPLQKLGQGQIRADKSNRTAGDLLCCGLDWLQERQPVIGVCLSATSGDAIDAGGASVRTEGGGAS